MKKSTIGDFDFSGIHQIDLGNLQSFFHHGGGGHHPSPAPGDVNFRSVDGSNNNLADPTMNQTGTDFARVGPANFSDGISAMTPGPNPRQISNILVAQADTGEDGPHLMDDNGVALSGMMYAWGQFVDHDLDLEKGGTTTDISITVPAGDGFLPPGSTIPLTRVAIDPATGVAGHPATAINTITGWLDGSQVYGSDAATAASLRISGELEGVDGLYQKGLVPLTRKTSLQREAARLDGERGQVVAAIAEAKSKISEAQLQAVKIDHDFRTEVMKDLREAQDKEAELVEKTTAAQDLLRRVDLRAPTNGIVHQLSVHTIGGVITPGEVVMEIVPESDELQIEAKLPPQEVDHVHPGQRAYIRFSAFNQRTTPQLEGVVSYVSADLNHDRQKNPNAATYYTVRVTLPPSERRRLGGLELVSGMPVEVFLQTGSRTMMSYLLKPISDQLLRTFN